MDRLVGPTAAMGKTGPRATSWSVRVSPGSSEIVVSPDGTGDVATIEAAVSMARDGDVVVVRPGIYEESLVVQRSITIVGEGGRGEVVIDFRGQPLRRVVFGHGPESSSCAPVETTQPFAFLLDRTDARLVNLRVRGPRVGTAFHIGGGAPTLQGIEVGLDEPWEGPPPTFHHFVFVWDRSRARIEDCRARSHSHIADGSSPIIERCSLGGMLSISGPRTDPRVRADVIETVPPRDSWAIGIARGASRAHRPRVPRERSHGRPSMRGHGRDRSLSRPTGGGTSSPTCSVRTVGAAHPRPIPAADPRERRRRDDRGRAFHPTCPARAAAAIDTGIRDGLLARAPEGGA